VRCLCNFTFACSLSDWPCAPKPACQNTELNRTVLSMYSGRNTLSYEINPLIITILRILFADVITYKLFSRWFLLSFLSVYFVMFLCCHCSWPYGCCASVTCDNEMNSIELKSIELNKKQNNISVSVEHWVFN